MALYSYNMYAKWILRDSTRNVRMQLQARCDGEAEDAKQQRYRRVSV